ncbi:MAG: AEC family transporter [Verrucomicrobia bacterium]|nr:AEC family transporter [Verrucomicrobiota bacterium]
MNWDLDAAARVLLPIGLIAGAIGTGYGAQRAGVGEQAARRLMLFVVTVPYATVAFLAIWVLPFTPELVAMPAMGMLVTTAGVGAGVVIARGLRLPRAMAGAFVLTAGASNLGFTMGGFVNYLLFREPGLAVAAMYTTFWDFAMVLLLYPVARHYGHGADQPLWRLIVASFADLRSLPLLATALGLTLNLAGVARPAAIARWHVVDVAMLVGAVVAFFVTGLRLQLGRFHEHRRLYALVALVKFLLMPAVAAALVGLMWLAGHPLVHPASAPGWKVALVQASTPSAIYAVVISNLFHLDDRLASVIFVVNTACYLAVVMPLVLMIFG